MSRPAPDDPEQFKRFRDAAKQHGLDISRAALDAALSRITPAKPPAEDTPQGRDGAANCDVKTGRRSSRRSLTSDR